MGGSSVQIIYDTFSVSILAIIIYRKVRRPRTKKEYLNKVLAYQSKKKKWADIINLSIEALNKFKLNENEKLSLLIDISDSYYHLYEYEKAIEYYNEALELLFAYHKPYHYGKSFLYAVDTLMKLGKYKEAKQLYYKIIKDAKNIKEFEELTEFVEKHNLV